MTETSDATKSWWDKAKDFSGPFWIFRGIAGSMALFGIVATNADIKQGELARAIMAILFAWNGLMAWLGSLVGAILGLPPFTAQFVNTVIIIFSLIIPYLYVMIKNEEFFRKRKGGLAASVFILQYLLLPGILIPFLIYTEDIDFFTILMTTCAIFLCSIMSKHYRLSLFYLVSFLIAVQIAYFLPFVGPRLQAFADEQLGPSPLSDSSSASER